MSSQVERVVGLMSGTSADGIDAVVAEISGAGRGLRTRVAAWVHRPFPPSLRQRILSACQNGGAAEVCQLNFVLGEWFARAALAVMRKAGVAPDRVAAIASHGQTIHHLPQARPPATLQIGEPAVIAQRTGILTVADFRVADMAAGGQGAPLVPYADWVLFTDPAKPRIIQNLGGIANLTFLPPDAALGEVLAFDTGPGNMVLDAVVTALSGGRSRIDTNGSWAARGRVSARLLAELMTHPFLCRPPPKTTGREEFGEPFVARVLARARRLRLAEADLAATVTAFTASTIADAYRRFVFPSLDAGAAGAAEVILGGGGAKNPVLRRMLSERLGGRTLLTHEDFGIPNGAKEALAFAVLAYETLHGRPANVPSATGARCPVLLGKLARPPAPAGALTATARVPSRNRPPPPP